MPIPLLRAVTAAAPARCQSRWSITTPHASQRACLALALRRLLILTLLLVSVGARAQTVASLLNYQGRVVVGATNFQGAGQFKFALVSADGATTYWSNDGTSTGGNEPAAAVSLPVTSGLYSVALGDTSLTNMMALPATTFSGNPGVYLRVWFNDGSTGSQRLTPDQRVVLPPYALTSGTAAGVAAGSVTAAGLATGAVTSSALAPGAVTAGSIANCAVTATQLAAGSVGSSQLAPNLTAGGTFTIGGVLALPNTTSATSGLVTLGGTPFLHGFGGSGNVFVGVSAGNFTMTGLANMASGAYTLRSNTTGNYNTADGVQALTSNTTGNYNTASGGYTFYANTSGGSNTANGYQALFSNTTGDANTASGYLALSNNTTGTDNTATGFQALSANTTGRFNTATGEFALRSNSIGGSNTACGSFTLRFNTTGDNNAASGFYALYNNSTGANNTAHGYKALTSNTTGGSNVALGYQAGANVTTGSNNVEIANQGLSGDTAVIRLGTQGTQTATYIAGISGATAASGVAVYVNSSGQLGTLTSSARYKHDIRDLDRASDALLALRPVAFAYKPEVDPQQIPQFSLVAEEVEKVCPDLVAHAEDGTPYTVRYEAVNAMLLNEFLKEHRRVQAQAQTIPDAHRTARRLESRFAPSRRAACFRDSVRHRVQPSARRAMNRFCLRTLAVASLLALLAARSAPARPRRDDAASVEPVPAAITSPLAVRASASYSLSGETMTSAGAAS